MEDAPPHSSSDGCFVVDSAYRYTGYMYRHMHTRTHIFHALIRKPLSALPEFEQERGNTRTHRTALLYDGQNRTK